ncbi:Imm50 family immunity protein [Streptomyces sp. DSM 41527]|uniref:Imm50 family immunity protein n=1 Tax=Streptomyces mooreae TaxID=3075523 RepID=A0ABU2T6V4_9ACTN|nr:Imm50 family immunity protein [Streptomyces sp. DSM 41527]MDT0455984.1 Imm50 family immunity protein [Streptomyces sp. DSM 41527]
MTRTWGELLRNKEKIGSFYKTIPALEQVALRSIHFDRYGPTVILRLDLPAFPDFPLPEWVEGGCDRLQCHVKFLAVEDVSMRQWKPPVAVDVNMARLERRRISVSITGKGTNLTFSSSDSLTVDRVSAFSSSAGGVDRESHLYAGKVDRMRFSALPGVDRKAYYE